MARSYADAFLVILLLVMPLAAAQPPPPTSGNRNGFYNSFGKFNPSAAVVVVVLIGAFFFIGFFAMYIRRCAGVEDGDGDGGGVLVRSDARSTRRRGVPPEVLELFPTMEYGKVKEHKIGKGSAVECAVCLSEFDDDEVLRLLPKCSHVFHQECIDLWFGSHVTCPVCRADVSVFNREPPGEAQVPESPRTLPAPIPPPGITVAGEVDEECVDLERIGSVRRAMRTKSGKCSAKLPRSNSTGHSLPVSRAAGEDLNLDRYTLHLPPHVLREIIAEGKLKRTTSLVAFPTAGEGSSRRGYSGAAGGEGSSRHGRSSRSVSISGRWTGSLLRAVSAKVLSAAGKKPGEGSTRSVRFAAADCVGDDASGRV